MVSYLSENVSPEDRLAVAELIQTTQQALGRASEALARIFLSFEASQVPGLAEEFLAFLRAKGLSKQRLSRIRTAARTRAELSQSSRLDLEPIRPHLLALGDDLLDAYQRLSEAAKEKAHAIIQTDGRISRQQLRQLQSDVVPFRVSPGPVSAAVAVSVEAAPGQSAPSFESHAPERSELAEQISEPGRCPAASFEAEPAAEPLVAVLAASSESPSGQSSPKSEPSDDGVDWSDQPTLARNMYSVEDLIADKNPPVELSSPRLGGSASVSEIFRRMKSAGLNEHQVLTAALQLLANDEVSMYQPHVREWADQITQQIDRLKREYES
ncbi:hypothetical protein [Vulcanococcus limneticus]|uniref:hypothetical protein n=1 Tax=Vulcanococcus limneticus TaxID=2170428 RepID=UPI00398BD07D